MLVDMGESVCGVFLSSCILASHVCTGWAAFTGMHGLSAVHVLLKGRAEVALCLVHVLLV